MNYVLPFASAVLLAAVFTPIVRRVAFKIGAVDRPGEARRIHSQVTARLGGVAIYLAIAIAALIYVGLSRELFGLLAAVTLLVVVGVVDDIKGLDPFTKLGLQVVAALIALSGGIGIVAISSPFGGLIHLDWGRFALNFGPLHFHITPVGNILSVLWMVGVVNVINFLDGLDGLATGISGIAALVLFGLSLAVHQPATATLAIILVGACLGFLPFNFNPAKIFLGDSGAYALGLMLAMIAIYSGSKLATATLVLGLPILDGVWTVVRRVLNGSSPFKADRGHLHHMMLDSGMTQRQVVGILYLVAASLGVLAVIGGSGFKLIVFAGLFMVMTFVVSKLSYRQGKHHKP